VLLYLFIHLGGKRHCENEKNILRGRKKTHVRLPGARKFLALGQVKVKVWWFDQQVKFVAVVLLVIISNQKQFLQDEQNNPPVEKMN